MKSKLLTAMVLAGSLFVLGACHDDDPSTSNDGFAVRAAPATIEIMMHSLGAYGSEPFEATQNVWHAFFEAPATPDVAITESTDLTQLDNFHVLYISQDDIDGLIANDMQVVKDWVSAGGILVIHGANESGVASDFGDFLGASYAFTTMGSLDGGDNIAVSNAAHRLLTVPNVLDSAALSNWSSSAHGVFSSVGSAYACVADEDDGISPLPVLCATPYDMGAIILTSLDPECDCHDDHLSAGTNSGSEMLENFLGIIYTL